MHLGPFIRAGLFLYWSGPFRTKLDLKTSMVRLGLRLWKRTRTSFLQVQHFFHISQSGVLFRFTIYLVIKWYTYFSHYYRWEIGLYKQCETCNSVLVFYTAYYYADVKCKQRSYAVRIWYMIEWSNLIYEILLHTLIQFIILSLKMLS